MSTSTSENKAESNDFLTVECEVSS